ncbi:MAG: type IV toxin-antitoxin system AbiEi family antitoxin [Tepidisphaeraceae bacterium]
MLKLIRRSTALRTRDLGRYGIPRWALRTLVISGRAHRVGRGLYVANGTAATEVQSYVEAMKVVSHGVICLLSALRMHGMTTQAPFEVWVAVDVKARKPKADHPPMRFARFSGKALIEGVEVHRIRGTDVRVYSPAKTIADCFKYRNKIGIDVALEALRDGLRQRKATRDDIHRMAKLCRVSNVIRPYMESLAL